MSDLTKEEIEELRASSQYAEQYIQQMEAEVARLGRCNEQISATAAETINAANGEIRRLQAKLADIAAVEGCECDSYHGYTCVLCKIREKARYE